MARSGPFCGTCRHFDEASIVWTGYDHEAACALADAKARPEARSRVYREVLAIPVSPAVREEA